MSVAMLPSSCHCEQEILHRTDHRRQEPPNLDQIPAPFKSRMKDNTSKQGSWQACPSNGYVVLVDGLPQHLVSDAMLSTFVDQAGLEKEFVACDVRDLFTVLLLFNCPDAADSCARHFHGRKWNPSESPVTARTLQIDDQEIQRTFNLKRRQSAAEWLNNGLAMPISCARLGQPSTETRTDVFSVAYKVSRPPVNKQCANKMPPSDPTKFNERVPEWLKNGPAPQPSCSPFAHLATGATTDGSSNVAHKLQMPSGRKQDQANCHCTYKMPPSGLAKFNERVSEGLCNDLATQPPCTPPGQLATGIRTDVSSNMAHKLQRPLVEQDHANLHCAFKMQPWSLAKFNRRVPAWFCNGFATQPSCLNTGIRTDVSPNVAHMLPRAPVNEQDQTKLHRGAHTMPPSAKSNGRVPEWLNNGRASQPSRAALGQLATGTRTDVSPELACRSPKSFVNKQNQADSTCADKMRPSDFAKANGRVPEWLRNGFATPPSCLAIGSRTHVFSSNVAHMLQGPLANKEDQANFHCARKIPPSNLAKFNERVPEWFNNGSARQPSSAPFGQLPTGATRGGSSNVPHKLQRPPVNKQDQANFHCCRTREPSALSKVSGDFMPESALHDLENEYECISRVHSHIRLSL